MDPGPNKLQIRAIRYILRFFEGPWNVGPVGDFLELNVQRYGGVEMLFFGDCVKSEACTEQTEEQATKKKNKHHFSGLQQRSLNFLFGGIKQCKCMVILRDFPYYCVLFGLVSYNDPCTI